MKANVNAVIVTLSFLVLFVALSLSSARCPYAVQSRRVRRRLAEQGAASEPGGASADPDQVSEKSPDEEQKPAGNRAGGLNIAGGGGSGNTGIDADVRGAYPEADYVAAVKAMDFDAVRADLRALFKRSRPFWPADYGNYAPFMIRLAWHNAGTYRSSDGRGGANGARQRFQPERSWEDNTNLDKARALLMPIKAKYGMGLSFGDLYVLAGNTAIESMGGPVLGFCAGRVDARDGTESIELGPTPVQQALTPCGGEGAGKVNDDGIYVPLDGNCSVPPMGATTLQLIYVNPEGFMGVPEPESSVPRIRETFGVMGMNDTETVALIGGGHAFGMAHGACPAGAGPSPEELPSNPWPGNCGTGRGEDTFTSGIQGSWTSNPTSWDNQYFKLLVEQDYEVHLGPGGHNQWWIKDEGNRSKYLSPNPFPSTPNSSDPTAAFSPVMMFTTDVALTKDEKYKALVEQYARDQSFLDTQFSEAWYKLMTRDMGPRIRCANQDKADLPPARAFQHPLPESSLPLPPRKPQSSSSSSSSSLPDLAWSDNSVAFVERVYADVVKIIEGVPELADEKRRLLARLAWRCAATYRHTDYLGGCNGARVRLSPQKDWPINDGLQSAFALLAPIMRSYGSTNSSESSSDSGLSISWADLIVLAGNAAIATAGGPPVKFCPGRSDASARDGPGYDGGSKWLTPIVTGNGTKRPIVTLQRYQLNQLGMSEREYASIYGGLRSLGAMFAPLGGSFNNGLLIPSDSSSSSSSSSSRSRSNTNTNTNSSNGNGTSSDQKSTQFSNALFTTLLSGPEQIWQNVSASKTNGSDVALVQATAFSGGGEWMRVPDMAFLWDPEFRVLSEEYASQNGGADAMAADFASAWTKLMRADRFEGPMGNACEGGGREWVLGTSGM